eukprot:gb/GECG01016005.1/.p1 GENE.gb/GECG01016005.1/~~gb/GECG01016005.1/.p1  ORF type:complete len:294 (+),score=56.97 gb/GECG01016005.1/:1-882(+)
MIAQVQPGYDGSFSPAQRRLAVQRAVANKCRESTNAQQKREEERFKAEERQRQELREQVRQQQLRQEEARENLRLVFVGQGQKNAAEHLQEQAERQCREYAIWRQQRAQKFIRNMLAARKQKMEQQKQQEELEERHRTLREARTAYGRSNTAAAPQGETNRHCGYNTYPVAPHFNIKKAERLHQGGELSKQTYHRWSYAVVNHGAEDQQDALVEIKYNDPKTKSSQTVTKMGECGIPHVPADTSPRVPQIVQWRSRQKELRKKHVEQIADKCKAAKLSEEVEKELLNLENSRK